MLFGSRKGINNASLRCFTDRVKASITHLYDAIKMEEVSIFVNFANSMDPTLRILDSQTHFKRTETFFSIHTSHPATHSTRKRVLSN